MVPRACLRDRNLHWHLQSEKKEKQANLFQWWGALFFHLDHTTSFLRVSITNAPAIICTSLQHSAHNHVSLLSPSQHHTTENIDSFIGFFKFVDTDEYKVIVIGLGQSQTNIWSSGLTLTDPYIRRRSYVTDEYTWHIFIGDVASSVMTLLYSSVNR
jgi:hypothetical protein